jgi:hypothetical protein
MTPKDNLLVMLTLLVSLDIITPPKANKIMQAVQEKQDDNGGEVDVVDILEVLSK